MATDLRTPSQDGAGWEALRAGAWNEAKDCFEAELAEGETGVALDGLARSRWWLADVPGAVEAWERAYAAYRRAGEDLGAARAALFLSKEHGQTLGNHAAANGWLARTRDLLGPLPPSSVHGWLKLAESEAEVAPQSHGCRVTYTEELTRLAGAPRIFIAPGISRIVFRISAKYMRRGFDGLLALAEERATAR